MGEIIIKVPEDVKEVIDLGLSYKEIKKKLEDIEKKEKLEFLKEFTKKYFGKLEIPTIEESEFYKWFKMSFFIDTNIFVETLKKDGAKEAKNIWFEILNNYLKEDFCVNIIVKNEVIFHLYIKRKLISLKELKKLFNTFLNLKISSEVENLMFDLIESYNLKPNDALILATCKHYNIKYLISLDEDFKEPCEKEGIILINSVEKLKEVLNT